MATQNPYNVLGLAPQSTIKEVKKAYRRAGLRHHPDRQIGKSDEERSAAAARFREAKEAYDLILSKAQQRSHFTAAPPAQNVTPNPFTEHTHRSWRSHHNAYFKQAAFNLSTPAHPVPKAEDPIKKEFLLLMEGLSWHYITSDVITSRCNDALAVLKERPDLAPIAASCMMQGVIMHGDQLPIIYLMKEFLALAPQAIADKDFKTLVDELGWDYLSTKTLNRHCTHIIAILEKRPDLAATASSALIKAVGLHGNDAQIIKILDLTLAHAARAITERDFTSLVHGMARDHQTGRRLAACGQNIAVILEKRMDLAASAQFAMMKVVKAYGHDPVVQELDRLFKQLSVQNLLMETLEKPRKTAQYH